MFIETCKNIHIFKNVQYISVSITTTDIEMFSK